MKKNKLILVIFLAGMSAIIFSVYSDNSSDLVEVKNTGSIFKVFVSSSDYDAYLNGNNMMTKLKFEMDPENSILYDSLKYDEEQNAIVILPLFTASAYAENGFYSYYKGECDKSCLTVPIVKQWGFESSAAGIQTLSLLGYPITNDYELSKNPKLLQQYDTVIVLHNEYVTKIEFDAINSHPNVVYLYPNAMYAEVNLNSNDTISLIRGHNYPTADIVNGFGWEFDNTPMEYNKTCNDLKFYHIDNGVMLNCYPENGIDVNPYILKKLKEF